MAVLATFLLALVPAAYAHMGSDAGSGRMAGEGGWHHGKMVKRVDIPVTVSGIDNASATFTVNGMAIEGRKGRDMIVTFDRPLAGSYNASSDMAYTSTGDVMNAGMSVRVDTANNSSLPVAGASAVLGLEKIQVNYKGKDYAFAQFGKISIYLPDGTVKAYDLEEPVKVIKSKDRKMVIWDAYPAFTQAMADALRAGATFPADAAPLKMSDYDAALSSVTPLNVGEVKASPTPPA